MTDQSTASAPRVTPESIEALIVSEHYFTAADGAIHASGGYAEEVRAGVPQPLWLLTFCVLVLRNGYTVVGKSACASPENFNTEIGREVARENAKREIWPLEGYALRQRLHDAAVAG